MKFPLGIMTVVSGVSGSGKSTLVREILYKAVKRHLGEAGDAPGCHKSLQGDIREIKAVEFVDQNPIGTSSRSNPATYLKAFDEIRKLFSEQQLAKQMGFTPSFFSFNSEGGRCEECKGEGTITIPMQFMADIQIECEVCHGKRYKKEVLDVEYKGKNIYDFLEMTIDQAIEFLSQTPGTIEKRIIKRLQPLHDVGLGYIKLGQSSSTLSGGENQRVKLAYFIAQDNIDHTLFIFDEPTTGLHFHDIDTLLKSLNALIDKGHTVIIIEHNMDMIKSADWIIDIGPEGGETGGRVVAEGTPEQIADSKTSYTAKYLKPKLTIAKDEKTDRLLAKTAAVSFVLFLSGACGRNDKNKNFDVAHQLFEKCTRITEAYIDSISNAPDSAVVHRMSDHFDEHMATVNYQFPANTDLLLSEEENDSLIRMHKRLTRVRMNKLEALGKSESDSVAPTDSAMKIKKNIKEPTTTAKSVKPSQKKAKSESDSVTSR